MSTIPEKCCSKCRELKPVEQFSRCSANTDGLYSWCKPCARAANQEYYTRKSDKIKTRVAEYRQANPERVKAAVRRYYQEHRAKHNEESKNWRHAHPERAREISKVSRTRHKAKHADRYTAKNHQRRVPQHQQHFTAQEWRDLRVFYNNICLCCKRKKRLTVDHIIPLSRGGTNTIDNIQPLCWLCNRRKRLDTTDYRPVPYPSPHNS